MSTIYLIYLLKWVEISEKRFNEILSTVNKGKNKGLRTTVDGKKNLLDKTESSLKDFGNRLVDRYEFENRHNDIVDDIEAIVDKPMIIRNKEKIVRIMSLLKEIIKTNFDK